MKIRHDHEHKSRRSLSMQITFVTTFMIMGAIVLCVFINGIFLEKYYVRNKTTILANAYEMLDGVAEVDDYNSNSFAVSFEKICKESNIDIQIMSPDGSVVCSSSLNRDITRDQFLDVLFGPHDKDRKKRPETDLL